LYDFGHHQNHLCWIEQAPPFNNLPLFDDGQFDPITEKQDNNFLRLWTLAKRTKGCDITKQSQAWNITK